MKPQDDLERIKAALSVLRAAPTQQELTDKVQPLAESLLLGAITENEFRESLLEISYQRTRSAALDLAKHNIMTRQAELEEAISREELSMQRDQQLSAARSAEANRPPKQAHNYGPRVTGGSDQNERH